MQFYCSDLREMVRYERIEPSDDDPHGDAVPTYERRDGRIQVGFSPLSRQRTGTDSGMTESESRWRAVVSFAHPFRVGDRMGPACKDAPTYEVVSCLDYPGSQNMEVRPL